MIGIVFPSTSNIVAKFINPNLYFVKKFRLRFFYAFPSLYQITHTRLTDIANKCHCLKVF
jgi:hypothetical protein